MATSRVSDVIDALVALWDAAPALADVKVIDGPPVTGDKLKDAIFVGYDGDPTGDGDAVDFQQDWASIGQKAKNETFTINCALVVWRGSTKVRPLRVRAFELLAAVEDTLRADPSLAFPPPTIAAFATGSLFQDQPESGVQVRITFQVAVQTRI